MTIFMHHYLMIPSIVSSRQHRRALLLGFMAAAFLLIHVSPARSALRVGMPIGFPPFSYQGEGEDRVRGYSVDVMETLGRVMDEETRFLVGDPDDLLTALAEGRIEMVCGVVLSDAIRQAYDYLEIRLFVKRFFYVNQPDADMVPRQLPAGKTIVVVRGQPFMDPGLQGDGANIIQARDTLAALRMLDRNQAQVFVSLSDQVVSTLAAEFGLTHIRQVGVSLGQFPLAIIVAKGDTALLKRLSVGLGMAISDGSLGRVQEKWLGERAWEQLWMRYRIYVWLAGGLALAGIGAVFLWNRSLKREVARVTRDLGATEQRYRDVIESSPDMLFVIDEGGGIRQANTSARRMLGRDEDFFRRTSLASLVDDGSRPAAEHFLVRLFRDGAAGAEMRLATAEGDSRSVEMAAARIYHGRAGSPLACCFARDITRRKRMEAELIQAERLATIGKMAASVAHEINNPIGIVLAHTEEIMTGELPPDEIQESLAVIHRNAVRAGHITETLLAQAAQNPKPQGPAARSIVDLASLIEACVGFVRPRLKKIRLETDLPPGRFQVRGDADGLQQVFINLLLNAADNVDAGGAVRIWLVAERSGQAPVVSAVVEDTGRGVPEADRERIFEPFFTRGKQGGFGLGLFVARSIVGRHGGDIRCTAGSDGGARMTVRIPQAGPDTGITGEAVHGR